MRSELAAAGMLCALLGGCVTPQERATPAAKAIAPASLAAAKTVAGPPAGEWPGERWWAVFSDPQLDALIDEALAGNPALRVAQARISQARAQVDAVLASSTPGFMGGLDIMHQRYSESGTVPPPIAGTTRTSSRLAMDFSFELDYAGRYDAALAAARASESAASADAYAARLTLSSALARAYFQLQSLFALRAISGSEIAQAERRIELTRQRFAAGLDTEVALSRAETVPLEIRAGIAQLDAAIGLARNQLAALAGQGPDRGLAIEPASTPRTASAAVPANLPLDLLGRRPDLAAARWRAESTAREIEVARLRFLPNVNLVAFAGLASLGLDRLLSAGGLIAGIGPAVRLPLFSAGGLQAALNGREADYDFAVERYNELLIDAVREVADQVQARRALEAERRERARVLAATHRTLRLAQDRYRAGIANYLEVLDAESPLFGLQRGEADLRARALQAEVSLYRALGGGYADGPGTR
jgi:NodT family efflux transporter outer membrane factor (OMF) lipoprotein